MVLGLMPDVEIVGCACDGEEAVRLVAELQPDVVLMDLRMPRCDGVEATRRIMHGNNGTSVVVLTTYADDHSVIQARRYGASGFLTKDAGSQEIAAALRAARRGRDRPGRPTPSRQGNRAHRPTRMGSPGSIRSAPQPHPPGVTVLTLIAEGLSSAEIDERLIVSERTVKSHINHGARDRAKAVAYAFRH